VYRRVKRPQISLVLVLGLPCNRSIAIAVDVGWSWNNRAILSRLLQGCIAFETGL
jgi:hypothetical protein